MKLIFFLIVFGLFSTGVFAQIEIPRTTDTGDLLKADPNEEEEASPLPSLSLKKESDESKEEENNFLREKPKKIDFRETNDDLLTAGSIIERKWKKDQDAKSEYKNDQYLGDFTTDGRYVEVYCRDHEYVDGDVVQVIVNGRVVQPSLTLGSAYSPVLVSLEEGPNTIEFVALNQGTSGPNTAELRVLAENGTIITTNRWNLLTGAKASIVVMKQSTAEE